MRRKKFEVNPLIKIERIDHIGIAVKKIDEASRFFEEVLGHGVTAIEEVREQNVLTASIPVDKSEIELLEATAADSAITRFIDRNGEGIQHIAFQVADLDEALTELKERNVPLIDREPRWGANHCRVAFVHPKAANGVLIELCEQR